MDTSELDEVVAEFITESHENLDQLDQELVGLEQRQSPDALARIFRTIHTIKGTSGFLGFSRLEAVTHVGENLLSKLRDGELDVTTEITSALLAMLDAIREVLGDVEATGEETDRDYGALVARLEALVAGESSTGETSAAGSTVAEPVESAETPVPVLRAVADAADAGGAAFGEQLLRDGKISVEDLEQALDRQAGGDPRHVGELLVEDEAVSPNDVVEVLRNQAEERQPVSESIRVDVGLLDDLMNLVGELVLARNQILQFTQDQQEPAFVATSQRLNLITTELQEGVMKTRMQPIENVWNKFPRVVRDLSVAVGKRARLEMEGKHTELDKSLLEAIKDPLTHLVRNAVDHGLEMPDERDAANKAAEGVVRMRAYHEGGQVIIEIADDGAGIDPQVIRAKGVQKGLLTAEEAAAQSDRQILDLIFRAGFSTAANVSNISGRGVGMDVVRTNIEGIGGSVDVHSVVGEGTTFKIKIPLTLAIIPALVVTCGAERYAIPQVSLLELVHVDVRQEGSQIEHVHGAPVFRLRGRLLPLVFLSEVLGGGPVESPETLSIVVLQADEQQFGLVVDQINDTAEIVVKPMGRLLKHAVGFSGATIMGDGLVALILDVVGIAHRAQVSITSGRARHEAELADESAADDRSSVLLVGVAERRFVLPLDTVARLEEFQVADVREAGDHQVVRYRGAILPLVRLADRLGILGGPESDSLQVLVCGTPERQVGLIVDSIDDIADERLDVSARTHTARGILGTAVVHGEVTDVLDLAALVSGVVPDPTFDDTPGSREFAA